MDNNNTNNALSRLRPSKRKLIQLYAALLYNCHIKGFTEGQIYTGPLKNMCVPSINCYSCPGAIGACPLGALQNALASSTTRAPAYMFGIIIMFGLLLGRTICGFLCPLGLVQELFYKIPSPKLKKNRVTRALSWFKYVILIALAVAIPLQYATQHFPVPGFCKYICPAGTLEGAMALLANPKNASQFARLGILFTRKFFILMLILAGSVFIFRVFCRFICPLGAIYGFFAKVALIGVRIDTDKCTNCGVCMRKCKMDIHHVGDHECINCGECIASCPAKAISWTAFGHRFEPKPATKPEAKKPVWKSVLPWVLALAVLGGIMWYVNKPSNNTSASTAATAATAQPTETTQPDGSAAPAETAEPATVTPTAEVGKEVGNMIPDFTAEAFGGKGTFNSADQRGKVLVINFWATYCTPCVGELPDFNKVAGEYGDKVAIVAVHATPVIDDVDEFIEREGLNNLYFIADDDNGTIMTSLEDSTMLPMTVIVDANGIITYKADSTVEYDKLCSLIDEAIASGTSAGSSEATESAAADTAPAATAEPAAAAPTAEVGKNVGNLIPDFTLTLNGGKGTFNTVDYRGKVLVINFWATYCTPCVGELPDFNKAAEKYGDKVAIVAVHATPAIDDIDEFISREGLNNLYIGIDTDAGDIMTSLEDSTMLPMTVIVGPDGVITYKADSTVEYDNLCSLIEQAMGNS